MESAQFRVYLVQTEMLGEEAMTVWIFSLAEVHR
jgi:hypothetical protein